MSAIDLTRLSAVIWALHAVVLAGTLAVVEPRAWFVPAAIVPGAVAFLVFTYLSHRAGEGR